MTQVVIQIYQKPMLRERFQHVPSVFIIKARALEEKLC
jgi:hypothetical protein